MLPLESLTKISFSEVPCCMPDRTKSYEIETVAPSLIFKTSGIPGPTTGSLFTPKEISLAFRLYLA